MALLGCVGIMQLRIYRPFCGCSCADLELLKGESPSVNGELFCLWLCLGCGANSPICNAIALTLPLTLSTHSFPDKKLLISSLHVAFRALAPMGSRWYAYDAYWSLGDSVGNTCYGTG